MAAPMARSASVAGGATIGVVGLAAVLAVVVDVAQRAIQRDGAESSLTPAPAATVWLDLAVYSLASLGLVAAYVAVVVHCRRGLVRGRLVPVVLGTPILIGAGLLLHRPALSTDVLSYVAQGSLPLAIPGATAYSHPAWLFLTPLGRELLALGWVVPWNPSPYGPFWAVIELGIVRLPVDVAGQIVVFKAVQAVAMAGAAAGIWAILGRVRPADRLTGTVLFLWNPVVLIELAGEGHNDGLMVAFVLAGLLATFEARAGRSVVMGGLATLVKYVPVVLVPPQLAYLWRTSPDRRAFARQVAAGVLVAAAAAAVLVALVGSTEIFEGVRYQGSAQAWPTLPGGFIALLLRFDLDARPLITLGTGALMVVLVAWASWRARDPESLILGLAFVASAYVVLVSTRFYAWYTVLPIALLALAPRRATIGLVVVLTLAARATAPLVDLRRDAYPFVEAWIVVTFAAVLACAATFALTFLPIGPIASRVTTIRSRSRLDQKPTGG